MAKFNTNYEGLAHHWVYSDDYSECYGDRMFSEKDKIYSYGRHYTIAQKIRDKKTKEVIAYLYNPYTNSATTNKQRWIVYRALPSNATILNIDPDAFRDWNKVLTYIEREYLELLDKASRARTLKEEYESMAEGCLNTWRQYVDIAQRAGIKIDKRKLKGFWSDVLNEELEVNPEKVIEAKEKRIKAAARAKARAQKKLHATELQKLADWKSGKLGYIGYLSTISDVHLRITEDKVETSANASVSIESAKVLSKMIKAGRDIKGHNIDGYTVISLNGTLKIGCHSILRSEVDRVINELID